MFLIEILVEFLFSLMVNVIGELFFRTVAFLLSQFSETLQSKLASFPVLFNFFSYGVFGFALGELSLLIFPSHWIESLPIRIVNLLLVPLLIGYLMSTRGKRLERKKKKVIQLDSFFYGAWFSFCYLLTRFMFAEAAFRNSPLLQTIHW